MYVGREGEKASKTEGREALEKVARAVMLYDSGGDNDSEEKAGGRAGGGRD